MKKLKVLPLVGAVALMASSCVVATTHHTTGNPIGTKVGYVKGKIIGNFDVGVAAAAKNGKITKIGSVDILHYASGKIAVKVTGE